jgi:flagellar basal-body rod modification protein FlgD
MAVPATTAASSNMQALLGGSTSSTSGSTQTSTGTGGTSSNPAMLTQAQFLQLLTAQLQNQDPSSPMQESDFTSQLAQFSTLSGIQQLNTTSAQMLQLQQLAQGAALVGKTVSYGPTAANASSGTVSSASAQDGQLTFQIGGQSVPSSQIYGVSS